MKLAIENFETKDELLAYLNSEDAGDGPFSLLIHEGMGGEHIGEDDTSEDAAETTPAPAPSAGAYEPMMADDETA